MMMSSTGSSCAHNQYPSTRCFDQAAKVADIAGDDRVASRRYGNHRGVGGISTATRRRTQRSCLPTEMLVDWSDVDGGEQSREVRLATTTVMPHLGDNDARRPQVGPGPPHHGEHRHSSAIVTVDGYERTRVEDDSAHALLELEARRGRVVAGLATFRSARFGPCGSG